MGEPIAPFQFLFSFITPSVSLHAETSTGRKAKRNQRSTETVLLLQRERAKGWVRGLGGGGKKLPILFVEATELGTEGEREREEKSSVHRDCTIACDWDLTWWPLWGSTDKNHQSRFRPIFPLHANAHHTSFFSCFDSLFLFRLYGTALPATANAGRGKQFNRFSSKRLLALSNFHSAWGCSR